MSKQVVASTVEYSNWVLLQDAYVVHILFINGKLRYILSLTCSFFYLRKLILISMTIFRRLNYVVLCNIAVSVIDIWRPDRCMLNPMQLIIKYWGGIYNTCCMSVFRFRFIQSLKVTNRRQDGWTVRRPWSMGHRGHSCLLRHRHGRRNHCEYRLRISQNMLDTVKPCRCNGGVGKNNSENFLAHNFLATLSIDVALIPDIMSIWTTAAD